MRRDVMKSPLDHVYDYGSTPLTRPERQLLELYGSHARFSGFETFCTDCPDRTRSRARSRCCQRPEPTPTLRQRLKARLS